MAAWRVARETFELEEHPEQRPLTPYFDAWSVDPRLYGTPRSTSACVRQEVLSMHDMS